MSQELIISLQITLVGMSLVFAALILLWWLMELLVRVSRERDSQTPEIIEEASLASGPGPDAVLETERRRRAALAAVAIALRESEQPGMEFPIPPTASVSPWQAINRANMLNKRGLRS
jgi:Na+-transporting methylmalonyl-CoA/oxaloacetate decarboxylase gamma subunit